VIGTDGEKRKGMMNERGGMGVDPHKECPGRESTPSPISITLKNPLGSPLLPITLLAITPPVR
jgi:hypothetical protein